MEHLGLFVAIALGGQVLQSLSVWEETHDFALLRHARQTVLRGPTHGMSSRPLCKDASELAAKVISYGRQNKMES